MNRNQASAKRASRAVLELVVVLSNGSWCRTSYLGRAAGQYIRPEIAWRTGQGNIEKGQRKYINVKLQIWLKFGRVEKRRNGNFTEWKLAKSDWTLPYLRSLIEILRDQAKTYYSPRLVKSRIEHIEWEWEICSLHESGFSERQVADRLGCSRISVHRVLKASKANTGDVSIDTIPLQHRMVITNAPPEKQPEIARIVAEKKLTVKKTTQIVEQARDK